MSLMVILITRKKKKETIECVYDLVGSYLYPESTEATNRKSPTTIPRHLGRGALGHRAYNGRH